MSGFSRLCLERLQAGTGLRTLGSARRHSICCVISLSHQSNDLTLTIALWCLATCSEYRTIGHLFGVARCTVCVIVQNTCKAIVDNLLSIYISFPRGEDLCHVVEGFKNKWGMIQCAGSIHGCHIPVRPPASNHTDYYNRKGWYSVLLQGVVDQKYLFTDTCIGWPGSVHNARVLANSCIYKKASQK